MAGKYWYLAKGLQGAGLNVTRKVGIVDELNAALLLIEGASIFVCRSPVLL